MTVVMIVSGLALIGFGIVLGCLLENEMRWQHDQKARARRVLPVTQTRRTALRLVPNQRKNGAA